MLSKLFTLLVRLISGTVVIYIVIFGIGNLVFKIDNEILAIGIGSSMFAIVFIRAFVMFNKPYKIGVLDRTESAASDVIDDQKQKRLADEMIKAKALYDNGIIDEYEYNEKISILKEKYLQ